MVIHLKFIYEILIGVTDEEVTEIYEEADLDKDNRLSFDEYLDIALKIEDEVHDVDRMMA
jgi:hypothetical protein